MSTLKKIILIITAGILPAVSVYGQKVDSVVSKNNRFRNVTLATGLTYSAALVGLNTLWYSDYDQSRFHTFNDNDEWLQVDKVGHAYSSYNLTKLSYHLFHKEKSTLKTKELLYAGSSAFFFLTTIEVFDGFSENWGFSWGDFSANTAGIALFVGQELLLERQIVRLKYSYQNSPYRKLRPNVLGENTLEASFKDYNGQTYWASVNLNGIYSKIKPKWLNLAIGYGGEKMIYANAAASLQNELASKLVPYRQYYLSLDIDWERIKTNKKWLRNCFKVANCIKFPLPTLELENSKVSYQWLYF